MQKLSLYKRCSLVIAGVCIAGVPAIRVFRAHVEKTKWEPKVVWTPYTRVDWGLADMGKWPMFEWDQVIAANGDWTECGPMDSWLPSDTSYGPRIVRNMFLDQLKQESLLPADVVDRRSYRYYENVRYAPDMGWTENVGQVTRKYTSRCCDPSDPGDADVPMRLSAVADQNHTSQVAIGSDLEPGYMRLFWQGEIKAKYTGHVYRRDGGYPEALEGFEITVREPNGVIGMISDLPIRGNGDPLFGPPATSSELKQTFDAARVHYEADKSSAVTNLELGIAALNYWADASDPYSRQMQPASEQGWETLTMARDRLASAVKLDPTSARAAMCYGFLLSYYQLDSHRGISLLRRAVELDPSSALCHCALGEALSLPRYEPKDVKSAEGELKIAASLDHEFAEPHWVLFHLYVHQNRIEAARAELAAYKRTAAKEIVERPIVKLFEKQILESSIKSL